MKSLVCTRTRCFKLSFDFAYRFLPMSASVRKNWVPKSWTVVGCTSWAVRDLIPAKVMFFAISIPRPPRPLTSTLLFAMRCIAPSPCTTDCSDNEREREREKWKGFFKMRCNGHNGARGHLKRYLGRKILKKCYVNTDCFQLIRPKRKVAGVCQHKLHLNTCTCAQPPNHAHSIVILLLTW